MIRLSPRILRAVIIVALFTISFSFFPPLYTEPSVKPRVYSPPTDIIDERPSVFSGLLVKFPSMLYHHPSHILLTKMSGEDSATPSTTALKDAQQDFTTTAWDKSDKATTNPEAVSGDHEAQLEKIKTARVETIKILAEESSSPASEPHESEKGSLAALPSNLQGSDLLGPPKPPLTPSEDNESVVANDTSPQDADWLKLPLTTQYMKSIMDPLNTRFEKLECPPSVGQRYNDLKANYDEDSKIQYFIALNLHEVSSLLPRLMGTIVEVVKFLGLEKCAISIVEGRSNDNTFQVLAAVRAEVQKLGSTFFLHQSSINPHNSDDRIIALADLRNLALRPLVDNTNSFEPDPLIIFSNDVVLCPEDILELIYQHRYQNATMTCALDWQYQGECFYDNWIGRSMSGDLFFEMPPSGWSADFSKDMFWDHPVSQNKFDRVQPLQVYSCWNGIVTMDGRPFVDQELLFRPSALGECYNGEPVNLAKDMWRKGIARIAVIPSVNVAYNNDEAAGTKKRRGYVSDHVDIERPANESQVDWIKWEGAPPRVKCIRQGWSGQEWVDSS